MEAAPTTATVDPPLEAAPRARIDLTILIGSIVIVGLVVAGLLIWPDEAQSGAKVLFNGATDIFGAPVQLLGLACLVMAGALCFSRFGRIKLGDGKPAYSTPSWLFMFISAGLGSATMYWAFMEWAYYYTTPGLNITPESRQALDMSTAYAYFHWGPIPWAMYAVAGVSMAYYFHVRRGKRLGYAGNVEAIVPRARAEGIWGRVIDLLFMFGTFGGLILTVTLSVTTVSAGISTLTGLDNPLWLRAGLLVATIAIFGVSSFVGLNSGLQRLAKIAVVGSFAFAAVVLVIGPTGFIVKNSTNAVGLEVQNFVHMALFTDPNGGGSFARDWTVFYWFYWISYLPGVAVFIARVSKGRTIRQTILGLVSGGCAGTIFFFGVLSSQAIHQTTSGGVDAVELLNGKGGDFAVAQLLLSLPLGKVLAVVYFVIIVVFLASHLDATSFSVAAVSTRDLPEGTDPARGLRLFWVAMLGAIPMAMVVINANLDTLKTGLVLTAIPFMVVLVVQVYGLVRWLRDDIEHLDPETGLIRLPHHRDEFVKENQA
ncbi:BCCT family transporter [Streptomyces sp. NPDC005840]|uniref:BCCT family transporter n=1 Tax=Streptomyces sp. NPDC005840 TaxID=3157072 RepID=UPI0033F65FBE